MLQPVRIYAHLLLLLHLPRLEDVAMEPIRVQPILNLSAMPLVGYGLLGWIASLILAPDDVAPLVDMMK